MKIFSPKCSSTCWCCTEKALSVFKTQKVYNIILPTFLFWFSIYTATIYIHYNSINSTMHSTKHWVNNICHSPCLWVCSKCIWQKSKATHYNAKCTKFTYLAKIISNNAKTKGCTYYKKYTKYIYICNAICVSFSHISLKKHSEKLLLLLSQKD